MQRIALTFCVLWAGPVWAEFAALSGDEVAKALTDQRLVYQEARQKFFASGKTLYESSEDSWGNWAVRGDQYCSQWPPGDAWDCYDVLRDGDVIRFQDPYGNATDGQLLR